MCIALYVVVDLYSVYDAARGIRNNYDYKSITTRIIVFTSINFASRF